MNNGDGNDRCSVANLKSAHGVSLLRWSVSGALLSSMSDERTEIDVTIGDALLSGVLVIAEEIRDECVLKHRLSGSGGEAGAVATTFGSSASALASSSIRTARSGVATIPLWGGSRAGHGRAAITRFMVHPFHYTPPSNNVRHPTL